MNDDELLARLKSADPALTPHAPLPDIDRLVEDILTTDTALQTGSTAPAKTAARRSRRQLFGLAAAAGLLLLGGGIAAGVMANNDNGHSAASAGPLTLTIHSGFGSQKCMAPSPDTLRGYPTLFVGTVTSIKGSTVTFRVDHWLKGGDTETVVLNGDASRPEALTFSKGERYIVAAEKGVVPVCGANGAPDETVDEFRKAFGK
ncbi:hypothetical protein ACFOZ0_10235 [Streptomyces yaanensis]|uniref:Uncharacterized protein n=1 Tax=Streptomyces yaanensis TaxID=1142239 RepID=A0ABV7SBR6_9ACTN|nr:hypothetical protein [Streptomyces sp. CGMCC 4.7035]WNB96727.1 hypothetical protein Q2K21_00825 [Streptomyces sp. CGMCC 4.7035]